MVIPTAPRCKELDHAPHLERPHQLRPHLDPDLHLLRGRIFGKGRVSSSAPQGSLPDQVQEVRHQEDIEVPKDEIVRGFEVDDDEYATVEKEELDEVEEEASTQKGEMEVLQFVEFGSLNPLLFENPYYAAPRAGGEKAYGVLRDALNETGRVGIARFQLRSRPTLATLLPGPKAIAIETLRPFEELRNTSDRRYTSAAKKPPK